ncbi:uncharacterized protein ACNLHF_023572 isoform 3-T7 [Anomaloglossus baeobatrachus]
MSAKKNKPIYVCDVCHVFCSSASHLSDHIGGLEHRNAVKGESPEFLANLQRLEYFLETFLKEEPMIGLEYVVEYLRNGLYSYKCLLCDTETPRGTTIWHLSGKKHIKAYLERHHPELILKLNIFSKKSEYTQQIKTIALNVQRTYGRKHILQVSDDQNERGDGSNPPEAPKKSSIATPKVIPPLKESQQSASQGTSSIESIIGTSEKLNQLDFKTNNDFLDYLRRFEIKNDGDAAFIQQITKNCTEALMKYREEQRKPQASSTLPSNNDPHSNKKPSDEANLSSISSPKECRTSAPILPIFQNTSDATEAFFKSIKNMNVSDVIVVLKRIAATNPAFRGINIPSLIKYLQDTGRLKNS